MAHRNYEEEAMIAGALLIAIVEVFCVLFFFIRIKRNERQEKVQKKAFVAIFSIALLAIGGMSLLTTKMFLEKNNYVSAIIFLVVFFVTAAISFVLAGGNEIKKDINKLITLPTIGALVIINFLAIKKNINLTEVFSVFSLGLFFPLLEETIFRGYLYNSFFPDSITSRRRVIGFIGFSIIFSLCHVTGIPRVSDFPYFMILFMVSLLCFAGRYFAKIDKIGVPVFIHGAYNIIILQYGLVPFLSIR